MSSKGRRRERRIFGELEAEDEAGRKKEEGKNEGVKKGPGALGILKIIGRLCYTLKKRWSRASWIKEQKRLNIFS